jgi:hypothetical protein
MVQVIGCQATVAATGQPEPADRFAKGSRTALEKHDRVSNV